MNIPIYQVDAFTLQLFSGNPAAVCPLNLWPEAKLMQAIAKENNLSATAFYVKEGNGFALRWFTPEIEIDLCGHATLATAHVLYEHMGYAEKTIHFYTRSGELTVEKENGMVCLNFPSVPLVQTLSADAASALGKIPQEVYVSERILMAVYQTEEDILALQPNMEALRSLPFKVIYATSPGKTSDFVSRVFGPAMGINEDPVTGSAHCTFTPYWSARLGKNKLRALQLSERRGVLVCENLGSRVKISGNAITFMKGEITI
jgi:PhzF family phenazine biosynthesis protein